MALVRRDKAQIDVEINGQPVKRTLADMQKAYGQLNRELRSLTVGSDEFNKKAAQIGEVKNEMDKARQAMQAFQKTQGVVAAGFSKVGAAIKTAFAPLFALLAVGEVIRYAQEMYNAAKAVEEVEKKLNQLSGASGQVLTDLTASAQAITKTFEGVEIENLLEGAAGAANSFRQEGEGLDQAYKRTFKNIENGLLVVVDGKGPEFLEQIKEYSVQFEQLGLTQEQTFAFIADSINKGVFNDKAPDSIKELGLSLGDLNKAQKEVLATNFGDQFVADLQSGKKPPIQALTEISSGLNQMKAEGKSLTPVISNIFRGAGEDAGEGLILSLQSIGFTLEDLIDTTNVYTRRQLERLEAERTLAAASSELAFQTRGSSEALSLFFTQAKAFFTNLLASAIEFFRYFPERWDIFITQAKEAFNSVLTAYNQLANRILDPADLIKDFEVISTIKIDESSAKKQQELFKQIATDREAFARDQEQKAIKDQDVKAAADRAAALKTQQANAKALEAERKGATEKEIAERKKEAERIAKEIADGEKAIQRLRIEVMDDGVEKRIAIATFEANDRISNLKGNKDQIVEQTKLIEKQLIDEVSKIRIEENEKATKVELDLQKKRFDEKVKLLESQQSAEIRIATNVAISRIEGGDDPVQVEKDLQQDLYAIDAEYKARRRQLNIDFEKDNADLDEQIGADKLARLRAQRDEELKIEQEKEAKRKQITEAGIGALRDILSFRETQINNALTAELAALDVKQKAEIDKAEGNEAKKAEINAKYEKLKEAAQKEAAIKQQRISIATTLINTAESIVKTGASLGYPAAIPFQVLAGTIGLLQLSEIRKQGFWGGGATGKADYWVQPDASGHKPVGAVHENEYVIPPWQYQSPKFRPIIDQVFEPARLRGFAVGGPTSTTPADATITAAGADTSMVMIEEIRALRSALSLIQFVMPVDEKLADLVQDAMGDLNNRRSRTQL